MVAAGAGGGALGRGYSRLDAILAGLGLPPRQWDRYQCAEFVAECYRRAGLPSFRRPAVSQRLIPDEIQRRIMTLGKPVLLLE